MKNILLNKTQLSDAMPSFLKPPLGLPTTCEHTTLLGHTTLPTTRPTTWQLVVGTGAHYIALIYSTQC